MAIKDSSAHIQKRETSQWQGRLAWLLVVVWLALVPVFFYAYFYQDHRWFFEGGNEFPDALPRFDSAPQLRVLHFIDESCSCSRSSRAYIESLQQKYPLIEHQFVRPGDEAASAFRSRTGSYLSSPAVALIDLNGNVRYFGPYTSGALCGEGSDFLSGALKQLEGSQISTTINIMQFGCFCPWPQSKRLNGHSI
ncbi:MAG: DUF6436 domain-containing protein [Oleiphilaceae bacterium]|nr:DUF6436 domain-containing protein [Oleiphilaceae bacterium]